MEAADAISSLCRFQGYVVWLDRERLHGGDTLTPELKDALEQTDVVIAVITPFSFSSPICASERQYAWLREKLVIPVVLDAGTELQFDLQGKLWRMWPGDSAHLRADLALSATAITPDQLGPGLSRLSPAGIGRLHGASSTVLSHRSTTSLMKLVRELGGLSKVLDMPARSRSTSGVEAMGLVQALLDRYVKRDEVTDDDIRAYLRKRPALHHISEPPFLGVVKEGAMSCIRIILESSFFAARPDIMFGESGLSVVYSILSLEHF